MCVWLYCQKPSGLFWRRKNNMTELLTAFYVVVWLFFCEGAIRALGRFFGFYDIIKEKESKVYVLFGDIVGVIKESGFHFLWPEFGWGGFFFHLARPIVQSGYEMGSELFEKYSGKFRRGHADGHWRVVRDVYNRSGG